MKTNILTRTLVVLVLALTMLNGQSQDINFSQFYDLPILRNPAIAGLFDGDIRVTSAYRNQWQSVTVPFRTIALGVEIKKVVSRNTGDFITFGIQMTNDQAGDSKLTRTQALPMVNYHKSLSADRNLYLSAAFMGGLVMSRFDPTQLRFDDQYAGGSYNANNPTRQSFSNTSLTYWDPSAGISLSGETGEAGNFYVGVGLFHITQPKVSFMAQNDERLHRKYVINAGYTTPTSDENRLTFYADLFKQGGAAQAQGGVLYMHDLTQFEDESKVSISGGMFYRLSDALIPVVKLDYKKWSMGATYDINVSKLVPASQYRGGLEVTLQYRTLSPNHISDDSYRTRCPKF
jgi:type IX secretion system PorP/SprF family membrane protein